MLQGNKVWVAQGENPCYLLLGQANRHGLIAGASGTGKTVTLKVLAEGFSAAGVPVFMADVKGDVTGMVAPGSLTPFIAKRMGEFGIAESEFVFAGSPCRFWDAQGGEGCPVRVTVSDMGPTLLARLLSLTEVQAGVLSIVFRIADDQRMLLIDLKDLRAMLAYVGEHAKEFEASYGRVSGASVGAIQRALLALEDQGATKLFGEPALELSDLLGRAPDGRGYVNILNATKMMQAPRTYAMLLLWMLTELYQTLPEVGDEASPRLVFFFDEAHLLFDDMPRALRDTIVQVVKLIRSKGVGVYFITQSASDIPDEVLAQLSNRIQHGLRAYTPAEHRAIRAVAAAFRANPSFDSVQALQELGTGEALVSLLDDEGRPSVVERAKVLFPACSMSAAAASELACAIAEQSALMAKYGTPIDRESAFEQMEAKAVAAREEERLAAERAALERERAAFEAQRAKEEERRRKEAEREADRQRRAEEKRREQATRQVGNILGAFGRTAARQVARGLFDTRRR